MKTSRLLVKCTCTCIHSLSFCVTFLWEVPVKGSIKTRQPLSIWPFIFSNHLMQPNTPSWASMNFLRKREGERREKKNKLCQKVRRAEKRGNVNSLINCFLKEKKRERMVKKEVESQGWRNLIAHFSIKYLLVVFMIFVFFFSIYPTIFCGWMPEFEDKAIKLRRNQLPYNTNFNAFKFQLLKII